MKNTRYFILLIINLLANTFGFTQPISPDDTEAVKSLILSERELARSNPNLGAAQRALVLMRYGNYGEAAKWLPQAPPSERLSQLAQAEWHYRHNRFREAEQAVSQLLAHSPQDREGLIWRAKLAIQAWQLPQAEQWAGRLAEQDEWRWILLGRIALLQKQYGAAHGFAQKAQALNNANAEAYLLESDILFWELKLAESEKVLRLCLEKDPYLPDARFNYGYAIWRRVDATQLPQMAAQWEVALMLDPLHYITHWHWGNGHTHLTYADYAQPEDTNIRAWLAKSDSLMQAGQPDAAIRWAENLQAQFPSSVLPNMAKGSLLYLHPTLPTEAKLDSAIRIFEQILAKKPHYGPAHNGLAAAIKAQRVRYLAQYDSLEYAIEQTQIRQPALFETVFPDAAYYPGNRVRNMIYQSLHSTTAYFPLLARLQRTFAIPPLHRDLAQAMRSEYFRGATTFDNRQWMDIRGVGSGAAGIEYVERGAHLERNVVLHEYVHLFHGTLFTDEESRRVRALYFQAMREGRTLDYYAANNEHEFLAQAIPAYFSELKVHPLNHKSMNTRHDLLRKDPATYSFVDSLVKRQRAFLAGDRQALAGNWAEAYLRLSEQARRKEATRPQALAYLDSALAWRPQYLPAYLSGTALWLEQQNIEQAQAWLARAKALAPAHPSVLNMEAEMAHTLFEAGRQSASAAILAQRPLLEQSAKTENDWMLRAETAQHLYNRLSEYGRWPEAVETAEQYAQQAPRFSTYLRDKVEEAEAFAHWQKGQLGQGKAAMPKLLNLLAQNPQNRTYRLYVADTWAQIGQLDSAIRVLDVGQRLVKAAKLTYPDFLVRIALYHAQKGRDGLSKALLAEINQFGVLSQPNILLTAQTYLTNGQTQEAASLLAENTFSKVPHIWGEYHYVRALLLDQQGQKAEAIAACQEALRALPYHPAAQSLLREWLFSNKKAWKAWQKEWKKLAQAK